MPPPGAESRRVLDAMPGDSPERRDSNWHRAMVHLALGEHDRAIDLLAQAYEDRLWQLRLLPVEPFSIQCARSRASRSLPPGSERMTSDRER